MAVERAAGRYGWSESWTEPPQANLVMTHTGLVVTRDGTLLTGAAGVGAIVARDRSGRVLSRTRVDGVVDLHDLTLIEEDGEERLWVAETATLLYGGAASLTIDRVAPLGRVHEVSLDGQVLRTLEAPALSVYETVGYRPTAVAVDERRFGGSGDIWVADGYGANLVHRFDADGHLLGSLTGEEGAGAFKEPHDVLIDRRPSEAELYVADRVNHRIQVFGLDGHFRRTVGDGAMPGPTQMTLAGRNLVVTDLLSGRLTIFDENDRLLGHLFAHPSPPSAWDRLPDGWPNARGDDGLIAPATLEDRRFHTPHGVAASADGTIYVSEFSIGDRIAVLG